MAVAYGREGGSNTLGAGALHASGCTRRKQQNSNLEILQKKTLRVAREFSLETFACKWSMSSGLFNQQIRPTWALKDVPRE